MTCKGICKQYSAKKPVGIGRYASGQKRCQICEIFVNMEGLHCKCCGYRLRSKPRNLKYKFKLRGIKTDSTTKTKYVGSGKDPKLKLIIDEIYLKSVPRLIDSQFESLKQSIEEDGLQEAISVNKEGKILDGHTRYQICQMLEIPVKYIVKTFKNLDEERKYVITANLKRRQLNQFQQFELVEALRNQMIHERNLKRGKEIWKTRRGEQPVKPRYHYEESTDHQISEMTGLGHGQIEACVYVKAHGNEKLINSVRNGEITTNKAKTLLLERDGKFYQSHSDRKVDQVPNCDKCGAVCRTRRGCHVHNSWCCTKCKWGI